MNSPTSKGDDSDAGNSYITCFDLLTKMLHHKFIISVFISLSAFLYYELWRKLHGNIIKQITSHSVGTQSYFSTLKRKKWANQDSEREEACQYQAVNRITGNKTQWCGFQVNDFFPLFKAVLTISITTLYISKLEGLVTGLNTGY